MITDLHQLAFIYAHKSRFYAGLNPYKASSYIRDRVRVLEAIATLEEWDENPD